MTSTTAADPIVVGVLALQGAFAEHILLLRQAAIGISSAKAWRFSEIRTADELARCHALIIPGGESTAISLVAARSGLLEPLREFVKVHRKPVWGTCAGLVLLAESANRTKQGGQELIGGLDVRVNRNHFGRQTDSFEADLALPFLRQLEHDEADKEPEPFHTVFIRAPVVEKMLPRREAEQVEEAARHFTVVAPSKSSASTAAAATATAKTTSNATSQAQVQDIEILARLPRSAGSLDHRGLIARDVGEDGDIVAVRQGNVFGTAFHPELTGDARIHAWWLRQVLASLQSS